MGEREVPSTWRKSSFSQNSDCAEWSYSENFVFFRNSKDSPVRELQFTHAEWKAFIKGIKSGEADIE